MNGYAQQMRLTASYLGGICTEDRRSRSRSRFSSCSLKLDLHGRYTASVQRLHFVNVDIWIFGCKDRSFRDDQVVLRVIMVMCVIFVLDDVEEVGFGKVVRGGYGVEESPLLPMLVFGTYWVVSVAELHPLKRKKKENSRLSVRVGMPWPNCISWQSL